MHRKGTQGNHTSWVCLLHLPFNLLGDCQELHRFENGRMLLIGLLSNRDQEAVVTVTVGKKWILKPPFPYGDKEWSTLHFSSGFDLFRFHFLIFILCV